MNRRNTKHGESVLGVGNGSAEYRAWSRMKARCSPWHQAAKRYVHRGIAVCDRWLGADGFRLFLEDVGRRPSDEHTLDRIDNNMGYKPGNVRWATQKEQSRNRSVNVLLTIDGVTKCISEWAESSPVSDSALRDRLRKGWSPEDAVFAPPAGRAGPKRDPRFVTLSADWCRLAAWPFPRPAPRGQ